MSSSLAKPARRSAKPPRPIKRRTSPAAKRIAAKLAGWVDPDSWQAVLEFYRFGCAYCGCWWEEQGHVVALSRGGRHHITNVVPICKRHNRLHGTRTVWPKRRHPFMEAE